MRKQYTPADSKGAIYGSVQGDNPTAHVVAIHQGTMWFSHVEILPEHMFEAVADQGHVHSGQSSPNIIGLRKDVQTGADFYRRDSR